MKSPKAVILIAVRMKSTRLPKKALADIFGKTVIERLIERMQKSKMAEAILCTSMHPDDKVLIETAKKCGIKWFAGSENDVLLRFIEAAERENAEIMVRVTGDNPLTDPGYIDEMIKTQIKTGAEYVYNEGLPEGTKAEVMTVAALKKCRQLAENPELSEYMTLYFKNSGLFKTAKVNAAPEVNRPRYRLTIDNPEDLELMRRIFESLGPGKAFTLKEVVELLDKNPQLAKTNANVKPKNVVLEIVNGKMRITEIN